ncbi:uncharacterized protein BYT42DRAFT_300294 [Radiomyces spectabilis]|uniref:uncharacterized protein n=1 Tax=Radiomyces spectabilis TaxID=64574 RepID=UPI00221EBED0|nr:uncharacterized protein BYT42DRAFT_300294 [Radiomyces spectabilis]KAI8381294.1 hypothetical protein BYT42DRAFT_300294 [Radiomyces spectabilis]
MSGKNQTRSTTRSQRQPSNRLLDGFSSSSPARPLEDLNRTELAELRDRNRRMLDNPSLLQTLPDKGAKLKDVNARIEKLLSTDANEDEYQRPDIRQKTVDSANAKAKQLDSGLHTQSSTSTKETSEGSTGQQQTRVRMMGLDESVRLQELQLQQIKVWSSLDRCWKRKLRHLPYASRRRT